MFIKIFNKSLKFSACVFIFITGTVFTYSLLNLRTIDSIITGLIFLNTAIVALSLVRYYSKAIVLFKIEHEHIIMVDAKNVQFKIEKDKCTYIINEPSKVVLKFNNGEEHYIIKYYFFTRNFSIFLNLMKEILKMQLLLNKSVFSL